MDNLSDCIGHNLINAGAGPGDDTCRLDSTQSSSVACEITTICE